MQRLTLPDKAPSGPWEFDPGAVLEALEQLGITRPVRVRWTAGYRRGGSHRWRNREHHITVSHCRAAEEASRTLWHELAHAAQTEDYGRDHAHHYGSFLRACDAWHRAYRNHRRAYEAAAGEHEALHDDLPLTRATRQAAPVAIRLSFAARTAPLQEEAVMPKAKEAPAASEKELRAELEKHAAEFVAYQEKRGEGVARKDNPHREGYGAYKLAYAALLAQGKGLGGKKRPSQKKEQAAKS